jgi:hypothetical protein
MLQSLGEKIDLKKVDNYNFHSLYFDTEMVES